MAIFLSVCAQSHLVIVAPSQGRGDHTGRSRGSMSLTNIASHDAERPQAGGWSWLQRQRLCHGWPCIAFHLSLVSLRGLPSSACLNTAMDAVFPPAPISSCSAWDQQMLMTCKKEPFGKDGLWSLFFNLLLAEQPVSVLLPLCKSSLKPFSEKCKGPFSVAVHPGAMKAGPHQAVQTMSCCWSCCRQGFWWELPFGNRDPALALACAEAAVPSSPCPPAWSPPACSPQWFLLSRFAG